jgi:hypothetical protein
VAFNGIKFKQNFVKVVQFVQSLKVGLHTSYIGTGNMMISLAYFLSYERKVGRICRYTPICHGGLHKSSLKKNISHSS